MKLTNRIKESIVSWLYPQTSHTFGNRGDLSIILGNNALAPINSKTALSNPAVWASVRAIAETIATLPCNVYKKNNDKREKATEHPLYNLLHNSPNKIISSINFFESIITHMLIFGNAFVEIVRKHTLDIESLNILDPDKIVIKSIGGTITYEYNDNGNIIKYSTENILHIAGMGLSGLVGFSPISLFANDIRTMMSQSDFALEFFSDGARKKPVLYTENKLKSEAKENLKKTFRDSWTKGIVLLEEGIKVEPMTMALSDAQFLESRRFSVEEIARIFRVPPHMIGELSHATFSNIEHQSMSFVRDTIRPWCTRLEKAFDLSLFNVKERDEYFVKFSLDALLRGDTNTRQQAYKTQLENGVLTINEWRALEDLPPIQEDYANDHFISQQVRPIKTAYMVDENKNIKGSINDKKNINDDNNTDNDIR